MEYSKLKYSVLTLLWAVVVIAADQGTKRWAIGAVNEYGFFDVLPILSIALTLNTGITFGLLADSGWGAWSLIVPALMIIAYLFWLWWRAATLLDGMLLMSVIGGALGNIIDRVRLGAVIDFIDVHYQHYHWPMFNVADSAVVVGIILFVWHNWRSGTPQSGERDAS